MVAPMSSPSLSRRPMERTIVVEPAWLLVLEGTRRSDIRSMLVALRTCLGGN